eukprot:CAMPEP_0204630620 /NCGR_PEP_ID=MMETSP0717-20131115/20861_1 /ASSEMBLY_ACC=CAM_ASM_000666 /TAXON_ID=230516 /ORGANISM="Chaetoceros curvisetus" /LENGTH=367 /DNA_ID=CAMNT_0051647925 /DNA_START=407 /DNA_END=1510 /DNA_ORIENTATION=+
MTLVDDEDDDDNEHHNHKKKQEMHDTSSSSIPVPAPVPMDNSDAGTLKLDETREKLEQLMAIPYEKSHTGNANDADLEIHRDQDCISTTTTVSVPTNANTNTLNIISYLQSNAPPALRLTDDLQQQRIQEVELLSSLLHSDDAIAPLKSLWMWERGYLARQKLCRAMELVSVQSYKKAEELYISLVLQEHGEGFHWVEPVHGLATLYYMRGKYEDAKVLLEMVLDVKPWHFDALSSMILVCTITNDVQRAQFWSTRRMPLLRNNPNNNGSGDGHGSGRGGAENQEVLEHDTDVRFAWVKDAVEIARMNLYNDSRVGRSIYAGQEASIVRNFRKELELKLVKEKEEQKLQVSASNMAVEETSMVDAWQ